MVASVSESADSTTVAGKLIKTDDCQQPSRDVSSTENQKGSPVFLAVLKLHRALAQIGQFVATMGDNAIL